MTADIAKGLELTAPWSISFNPVKWIGDTRVMTDMLPPSSYSEAVHRCEILGGKLAGPVEYKYAGVEEVARVCDGCWMGGGQSCSAYVNNSETSVDCSTTRSSRCYRLLLTTSSDLSLLLYLRGHGNVPSAAYPLFVSESADSFMGRVIEVLISSINELGLPLVPHEMPETTVFTDVQPGWSVRRVKFDLENTLEEWNQMKNDFNAAIRSLLHAGAEWVLYEDSTVVGELLRVSLAFITEGGRDGGYLTQLTAEDAVDVLNLMSVNVVDGLKVVGVHKIRFSDPPEVVKTAKKRPKEPSKLVPTMLLVGIAGVSTLFIAAYILRTLRATEAMRASTNTLPAPPPPPPPPQPLPLPMHDITTVQSTTSEPTPVQTVGSRDRDILTAMQQLGINPLLTGGNQRAFGRNGGVA
eukprot:TRINITY_DN702_c0_g3_i1.p1 TRINITY_DN702_c0_g3~~TRINITY_DN702_c0_g3_i1.p1  ORF type:complete len:476 (+),score=32.34 TRINITY_DN702_c0_g3_i1:199-1428(+)